MRQISGIEVLMQVTPSSHIESSPSPRKIGGAQQLAGIDGGKKLDNAIDLIVMLAVRED